MEPAQHIVAELLAKSLFGTGYIPPEDTDWDAVLKEAQTQCVVPLVYDAADIPDPEAAGHFLNRTVLEIRKNAAVFRSHGQIHALFTENRIPYTVLKGCSSAYYYRKPSLRVMGDVDILVPPEALKSAAQVLIGAGFTCKDAKHDYHSVFTRGSEVVELHRTVTRFSNLATGDTVETLCQAFLPDARQVSIQGSQLTLMLPSPFCHGLCITLHTARHLTDGEGVGLRHLSDLAVFYDHFDDSTFEELFRAPFQAAGLWRFTQYMGQVCHLYLHMPYRTWMGDLETEIPEKIFQDILLGGNLGRRHYADNTAQNLKSLTYDRAAHQVGTGGPLSRLSRFFRNCNRAGKAAFPKMDLPLLRHFAWFPFGVRYLYRCLTGKRRLVSLRSVLSSEEKREDLYLRLLYHRED